MNLILRLIFFWEYLKNPVTIGSVTPSSRFLTKAMLASIDFKDNIIIVELGPGNGCMTKELLRRMPKNSRLIAFEVTKKFIKILNNEIKDERLILFEKDAQALDVSLNSLKLDQVDFVLSGLPTAGFPKETQNNLVHKIFERLKLGGKFIQFHYFWSPKIFSMHNLYKRLFRSIKISFIPLNIPPAFVFTCEK